MSGRVQGKVAFITGAARGQGREHAVRLAEEGADIIAVDICQNISTIGYPMATREELDETAELVKNLGQKVVAFEADVRDVDALRAAVATGVSELGRIDTVVCNAGILGHVNGWEIPPEAWKDTIDVCLTGVYNTCQATIPQLLKQGDGGSIVMTGSRAASKGLRNLGHYDAAKHGVVGLMRAMANELAEESIRVNVVNPHAVDTIMVHNPDAYKVFAPHIENPTREDAGAAFRTLNAMPVDFIDAREISQAVLWLASDESRFVTGQTLGVDLGAVIK
ncbi:mycofactocin-coupled SDR family oxidoreductase [Rhodococcus sp. Chr-9]|uniref:mycofactocin-coupled SDR family oxidoreductase n=1 Tax=Rhodococcus sp. Chr-9 TaxID=713612 RepID=UPI0005752A4B|nr:mycofactocin-coupled SDR family oxidoreductase [Rhodococcus sp. Chr-9]KHJ71019.1 3-ketoacyl-ACP reductase [Rhodococcus sp. Chr-9]